MAETPQAGAQSRKIPNRAGRSSESGAVLVMIAISIAMLLGFVAFVFDMGRIYVARAELQGAADAMVVATADLLPNEAAIEIVAEQYAVETDGTGAILDPSDVVMGYWDDATSTFTPGGSDPNAVQITARRAVQNSNPVDTVFAKIFGFDTIDVSATSIAARGIVDADVVILQDVTVSFLEEIQSAIDADKTMVDVFADQYPDSIHMGVVSFARATWVESPLLPLNTGADQVKYELDHMHQCTSSGRRWGSCYGTDIAIGIDRAQEMLENGRPGVDKVIVLVSDGLPCIGEEPLSQWVTTGQEWATASAEAAGDAGTHIFAVTLYTPSGPTNNPCSTADISYNESLARNAGFGVTTTDPDALGQILASVIDELPVRLVR